jgi:hypothetical protein
MTKIGSQLQREIDEALSVDVVGSGSGASTTNDVTSRLLASCSGPGEYVKRVHEARPAKSLTPSLRKLLDQLRNERDLTIGRISNPLAYGGWRLHSKSRHRDVIRLIKGGFVRVVEVNEPPDLGTMARRDSPYGDRYYRLEVVAP